VYHSHVLIDTYLFFASIATVTDAPVWLAPELLTGKSLPTLATDVYALGMLLYEIIFSIRPFKGMSSAQVREIVLAGGRSSLNLDDYDGDAYPALRSKPTPAMLQLIADCWAADPAQRPTASSVVNRLMGMKSEERYARQFMLEMQGVQTR